MRLVVLGAGAQGSAAAFDLLRSGPVESVVLADRVQGPARSFLEPFEGGPLERRTLDARRPDEVRAVLDGADAVLCALPYGFGYEMAALAVEAGAHYCDLGGNLDVVRRQRSLDEAARSRGVSVVPDCGLAPGMVNVLAQAGIDALDEVASVRLLVGGLPRHPKPPLDYHVVYSLEGVLDYYTTPSVVLEDGELREKEALSEVETVDFGPLGALEAFHTAGGVSSLPERYRGRIPEMVYKTLRYPGHAAIVRAMRELGLFSLDPVDVDGRQVVPRRFFIDVAGPHLTDPDAEDLVALRVEVRGERNGGPRTLRYDLLDYFDRSTGMTAMMRTTGFSLAVTALMQVDGRISEPGVHTPDACVPADEYVRELAERGVEVRTEEV